MNQTVLITGASSGLGAATAEYFAKKGYNVVIHYHTHENIALKLKEKLESEYQVQALSIKANLQNEEEIKRMVEHIIDTFKTIDVLVNNAGIAIDTTFEDKTKENFMKILDTNLVAPFLVSKYVSKIMLQNKKGSIINVSSTNAIDSYYPYSMDYDSSKAGLNILTKNMSVELAPYIRVNAIAPGWINTPMNEYLDKNFKEKEINKIALNRFAEPIEIAKIIYFLASDDASYINGSIIVADGGRI